MIKFLKLKIIIASLIIGGCATGGFQGDVVSRDAAGKQQFVQTGVVVSLQNVTIEGAVSYTHLTLPTILLV